MIRLILMALKGQKKRKRNYTRENIFFQQAHYMFSVKECMCQIKFGNSQSSIGVAVVSTDTIFLYIYVRYIYEFEQVVFRPLVELK